MIKDFFSASLYFIFDILAAIGGGVGGDVGVGEAGGGGVSLFFPVCACMCNSNVISFFFVVQLSDQQIGNG